MYAWSWRVECGAVKQGTRRMPLNLERGKVFSRPFLSNFSCTTILSCVQSLGLKRASTFLPNLNSHFEKKLKLIYTQTSTGFDSDCELKWKSNVRSEVSESFQDWAVYFFSLVFRKRQKRVSGKLGNKRWRGVSSHRSFPFHSLLAFSVIHWISARAK